MNINDNDFQNMVTHALEIMKEKDKSNFSLDKVNLAEMQRITGISRSKLRRLKKNRITNSEVVYEKVKTIGYKGSLTSIKRYIATHKDLIHALREVISPQGNRGRRYQTELITMSSNLLKISYINQPNIYFQIICHIG